jgi:hypothetical protein
MGGGPGRLESCQCQFSVLSGEGHAANSNVFALAAN